MAAVVPREQAISKKISPQCHKLGKWPNERVETVKPTYAVQESNENNTFSVTITAPF
jgi:hypothetical protein